MTFRLAIVDSCRDTRCLEVQKKVPDESGKDCWVHYVIVKNRAQALTVVAELEPLLAEQARLDLTSSPILDSKTDRSVEARMAKHLRGWGKAHDEYKAKTPKAHK